MGKRAFALVLEGPRSLTVALEYDAMKVYSQQTCPPKGRRSIELIEISPESLSFMHVISWSTFHTTKARDDTRLGPNHEWKLQKQIDR